MEAVPDRAEIERRIQNFAGFQRHFHFSILDAAIAFPGCEIDIGVIYRLLRIVEGRVIEIILRMLDLLEHRLLKVEPDRRGIIVIALWRLPFCTAAHMARHCGSENFRGQGFRPRLFDNRRWFDNFTIIISIGCDGCGLAGGCLFGIGGEHQTVLI